VIINILEESDQTSSQAKSTVLYASNIIPDQYKLNQNYPNPFNPFTHISYELPKAADVSLRIYNIKTQMVGELVSGHKEAGNYEVVFNGLRLASGIYFYRFEAGKFS